MKKEYHPESNQIRFASFLFSEIRRRKPDYKEPNLQRWAVHIDRMIRLDKRKPETITRVIIWCQQDDFWQNNILSTDKLRKHFDRLELQMNKGQKETFAEKVARVSKENKDGR